MKKAFQICIIITIVEFITAIIAYFFLPEMIPVHWGVSGQVDGYGRKFMIFLAPVISLLSTFGMYYMPKIDPKGENIKKSGRSYPAVMILINFIMVVLLAVTILTSFGYAVSVNIVMPIAIGIMFLLIGNYLPKIKPNYFFGIRLPWTLADETVWTKTHRFSGLIFFLVGLLFILGIFIPVPYNFIVPIASIFIGMLIISVYSYFEFKKIKS